MVVRLMLIPVVRVELPKGVHKNFQGTPAEKVKPDG